jgi:putative SOS response-associated peptidase YedK
MPVILASESFDLWLSDASRSSDLKDLLVPFPADLMKSHAVGYEVNDTKTDDASLLREVEPNIGMTMKLF